MVDWLNIVLAGLLGVSIGSFINVVADRLPRGQSLVSPPSHCPVCDTKLKLFDLIPLLSYLGLRGKCRYCSAGIPFRIFAVELATGLLFVFIGYRFGFGYQGIAMMGFASLFTAVFLIDLEHQIIPNKIVFPAIAVSIVVMSFWPGFGFVQALIGAGAGFGLLLLLYIIPGVVIGEGDVKFAAVVGAATGFPVVLISLGLAFVLGGAVASVLLVTGKSGRKQKIAFGPFIVAAAMVSLIWGQSIVDWYVQTFWLWQ
jgi:prepilin signal peptidase PulO-like enzyme (type II secretory pathway)